jgi:selenium-binding protein 1
MQQRPDFHGQIYVWFSNWDQIKMLEIRLSEFGYLFKISGEIMRFKNDNIQSNKNWRLCFQALLAVAVIATIPAQAKTDTSNDTLLLWVGDRDHNAPDFVAAVEFDPRSANYGKIVSITPLPSGTLPTSASAPWGSATDANGLLYGGAIGNEPHHAAVSVDKKTFVGGGLLSVLNGQNQTFFFDVSNPRQPAFIKAEGTGANGSLNWASIADDFEALSNGHFIATYMGSKSGNAPGRVLEFDAAHNLIGVWPDKNDANLPAGFNPHGLAVDEARNLLVTSDFICPIHTIFGHSNDGGNSALFRGSVRYWNFRTRQVVQTIPVGNGQSGTISVELIPGDYKNRSFVSGVTDGNLYLVDPTANGGKGVATSVFNFNTEPTVAENDGTPPWPHLIAINKAGTRLFITLNFQAVHGKVAQFDISNPSNPKLLTVVDLGLGAGPHFIGLTDNETRLVVSDYFVNENLGPNTSEIGLVQVEGDHKVHVLNVTESSISLDPRFNLDLTTAVTNIPGYNGTYPVVGRPHGFAIVEPGEKYPRKIRETESKRSGDF